MKGTKAILGIDAAWTEAEPSGVALIQGEGADWDLVCVAPSYDAFVAAGRGTPVDWNAERFDGSRPDVEQLLEAARALAAAEPCVVAVDMPMATVPITQRRTADSAISRTFGGRGCSTHSPSSARPGPLGAGLTSQLNAAGFPLATAAGLTEDLPRAIEIYPHPALLFLLRCDRRVPYKVARSSRYWPGSSVTERISRLLHQFERIHGALGSVLRGSPLPLPSIERRLSRLKRFEDALDALVSAWVGSCYATGNASSYGDATAAIWVPASSPEPGAARGRTAGRRSATPAPATPRASAAAPPAPAR